MEESSGRMWIVLDQFSRTLIDAAVANAILLSVVVVFVVFTRQPARRIVLVRSGAYAALLMFPLVAFGVFPRVYPVDWLLTTGLVPPPLVPEADPLDALLSKQAELVGRTATGRRSPDASLEWPAGERLVRVATLLYLIGAGGGLAWMGLGAWGFRRLRNASGEPGDKLRGVFDELIADLGRSPPFPALRVSPRLRSPALGGVVRPVVVVPAEIDRDDFDRDALRLILLHELAHADRGDAWFNALASLAQLFWFFLPHPWWLRGQMRIDQEFIADRVAAGPLGESTRYASWLVGISSGRHDRGAPAALPEGPARPPQSWLERGFNTQLLQRVAMLLYCPFAVEGRAPRWFAALVPVALTLAALPLSSLRVLAPVDPVALVRHAKPRDPLMRDFALPEFVVVPSRSSLPGGPYVLPLALPAVFHLEAEIVAGRRALGQLRIANCPVAPPSFVPADAPLDHSRKTHRYTLRRDLGSLRAGLDGEEFDLDPKLLDGRHWLTITPAAEVAVIRDLVIRW